ncbi:MAG: hypothetical protein II020_06320, partial [Lachnospiraceae bacterium]|nr:hypothetical protein [Lachnospiraceae bacterium]
MKKKLLVMGVAVISMLSMSACGAVTTPEDTYGEYTAEQMHLQFLSQINNYRRHDPVHIRRTIRKIVFQLNLPAIGQLFDTYFFCFCLQRNHQ